MRRCAAVVVLLILPIACTPELDGPVAPIAVEQFTASTALDASAARQAVVDFVDAYAASPTEGAGALANLVAGAELASWVRWLDVQHREFPGSIDAAADIRDVEFITSIETPEATEAQVGLSASVTFDFAPDGDQPFARSRILDGPVRLVRAESGSYLVADLLRDGVPMTDGIRLFDNESRSQGGVQVVLDSLFMFAPNWQFNVVVRNLGTEPVVLDRGVVGLYVDGTAGFQRLDGQVTGSLLVIPPGGQAEGILAYPLQDSGEGRVLSLAYASGRDSALLEFPLDGLVDVVPPPPPTGEAGDGEVTA